VNVAVHDCLCTQIHFTNKCTQTKCTSESSEGAGLVRGRRRGPRTGRNNGVCIALWLQRLIGTFSLPVNWSPSHSVYHRYFAKGSSFCPADSPDTRAGGAAVAVREALQLCQVHVLFHACVVGRVELLVSGGTGAGGQVLHWGAHRVRAALREPDARVRAFAQTTFLNKKKLRIVFEKDLILVSKET
jgi:hypothetical protein